MKAICLFSGCGMVTEGLKQAGYQVVLANDNDPLACAIYAARHGPAALVAGCLSTLHEDNLRPWRGIELLQASPPCPSYSVLRRCAETETDYALATHIARVIATVLPERVIIENVPKYQGSRSETYLRTTLAQLGYLCAGYVLNAGDYGVAQERYRYLLIGTLCGIPLPTAPSTPVGVGWGTVCEGVTLPPCPVLPLWRQVVEKNIGTPTGIFAANMSQQCMAKAGRVTLRTKEEPLWTITAGSNAGKYKVWEGRWYKATPHLLARCSGLPDGYPLPPQAGLATRLIGNGVPPPLIQAVASSLS